MQATYYTLQDIEKCAQNIFVYFFKSFNQFLLLNLLKERSKILDVKML